jgi:hypothetical protein
MAVCSMQWTDHLGHLGKYLDTFRTAVLTFNYKKFSFVQRQVKLVGHIVGSGLLSEDPDKIKSAYYQERV